MQTLGVLSAAVIMAAGLTTAALAGQPAPYRAGAASQVTPTALEGAVAGARWNCVDNRCVGAGGQRQAALDDCRKVAAAIGPLAAYSAGGQALKPNELAACNRMAGKTY